MRYLFEDFVLDTEAYTLHRDGQEIAVEMRVLESLALLIRERHRVLGKEELLETVWEVDFASEATLFKAIQQARKAVDDDGRSQRLIKTVHGRGYRFVGEIREEACNTLTTRGPEVAASVLEAPKDMPARRRFPSRYLLATAVVSAVVLVIALAYWKSSGVDAEPSERISVAVLPCSGDSKLESGKEWMAEALPELLGLRLRSAGGIRLLSSDDVAEGMRDLGLEDIANIREDQSPAILERLNCDAYITSRLLPVKQGGLKLAAQIHRSGEEASPEISKSESRGDLFSLVGAVGARLASQLSGSTAKSGDWKPDVAPEAFARYAEGARAARDGNLNRAVSILAPLLAQYPDFPQARIALARVYVAMGLKDAARQEVRTALELSTQMPAEIRLRLEALNEEIAGKWGEAARIYRSLSSVAPDEIEYSLALIRALRWDGQSEEAIRVANHLGLDTEDDPRLLLELSRIYQLQGLPEKQRSALEKARDLAEARGATGRTASAILGLGWVDLSQNRLKEAEEHFSRAKKLFESVGNHRGAARCFKGQATAISYGPEPEKALPLFEESAQIARDRGDFEDLGKTLYSLTGLLAYLGEIEKSLDRGLETLEVARRIGDREVEAAALVKVGDAQVDLGRPTEGLKNYAEAMKELEKQGATRRIAGLHNSMALACENTGDTASARRHFEMSMAAFQKLDNGRMWFNAAYNLAWLQLRVGDPAAAGSLLSTLRTSSEGESEEAAVHHLEAGIAHETGDFERALKAVRAAIKLRESTREGAALYSSQELEMDILLSMGRTDDVLAASERLLTRFEGDPSASALLRRAEALSRAGQWKRAASLVDQTRKLEEYNISPLEIIQREILGGRIQAHLGHDVQAEEALDRARQKAEEAGFAPLVMESEIVRAEVLIRRGKLREAREDLGHLRRRCESRGWGRLAHRASELMDPV